MMIVSWILYASVVGILVGAAAVSAERIFRDHHLPTRWVWCASLLATLAVPALGRLFPESLAPTPFDSDIASSPVTSLQHTLHELGDRAAVLLARIEDLVMRGWGFVSGLLVLIVGISIQRLRDERASWREESVDGTSVLVSGDVGPAVLGVFRQRIVLPAWVLTRSPEAREMILSHEREHVRARDPLMVVAGALPSLFVPWHIPLWWQYRRLRLAVEMDCDERVLRRATSSVRRRYGHLLLEVGRRKSGVLALAAPFSEERSFLGRRIRGLAEAPPRHPLQRDAVLSAVGLVFIAAAWSLPRPALPAGGSPDQAASRELRTLPTLQLRELPLIAAGPAASVVTPAEEAPAPASSDAAAVATVNVGSQVVALDATPLVSPGAEVSITSDEVLAFTLDEVLDPILDDVADPAGTPSTAPQGIVRPTFPDLGPLLVSDPLPETDLNPVVTLNAPTARDVRLATADPTVRPQVLNADEIQKQMQRRYPPHLLDAGVGGTVVLDFFVDENGMPTEWAIVQSSGHQILDDAALRMAGTFRFSPARRREQVVPVWARFPIRFQVL